MSISEIQFGEIWDGFPGEYRVQGCELHESSSTKSNFFGSILNAKWSQETGLAINHGDIDRVEGNNIILKETGKES